MYVSREEEERLFRLVGGREALALIGPRRAGKTTLALRLLELWREKGGQGVFFDLEALGAPSTAVGLLNEIQKAPAGSLVVLDEVQNVTDWVKVVRQEIERRKRHFVVTGSSATLLSKEIASSLGGRAMPELVLGLSFRDAKKWGLKSLEDYLSIGGYPECVLRPYDAPRLHKLYLELTVLRDVAARQKVREIKPLSDLALLLLSEPGKTISSSKTSKMLGISEPTFRSFASAFNDAFLILSVQPFLRSPRQRIVSDAKHYSFDTGLQKSVSVSTQEDEGRRVENAVAIELFRRGYSLSYLKGDAAECDFIAQKPGEQTLAIQVWIGSGVVPEREWRGLKTALKTVGGAKAVLLTGTEIPVEQKSGVLVKTVEEWLLEPVQA